MGQDLRPTEARQILNVARTVAAVLVVANHIRALCFVDYDDSHLNTLAAKAFYSTTNFAHSAVMLFFCLSGYWVGGSVIKRARRGTFTLAPFMIARLARLWIVLVPALGITLVFGLMGLHLYGSTSLYLGDPGYHNVVPNDLRARLSAETFVQNVGFLQSLRSPTYGNNGPLWSLAYEFWYYIAFAGAAYAVQVGQVRSRRVAGIALAAVALGVGGSQAIELFPVWLAGAGISLLKAPSRMVTIHQMVSVAVLLSAFLAVQAGGLELAGSYLVGTASCYFVWAGTGQARRRRASSVWAAISRYGGHASYSLYCVHLPVLVFVVALIGSTDFAQRWQLSPTSGLAFALILLFMVGVGWIFSLMTEAHTGRLRRRLEIVLLPVNGKDQSGAEQSGPGPGEDTQ